MKEQFVQKWGGLRAMHTTGKMLMHKKTVQAEGGMPESCRNKRQDAETQSQHNADNTTEQGVITSPMVMGDNNNENSFYSESTNNDTNSFFSELIINEKQSFSDQSRQENMVANVKQATDSNNSESFISYQSKDPDTEAKTIQTITTRKQKKKK